MKNKKTFQINLSIPIGELDLIDKAAKKIRRSRSNFMHFYSNEAAKSILSNDTGDDDEQ